MKKLITVLTLMSLSITNGCNKIHVQNSKQLPFDEISSFIKEIASSPDYYLVGSDSFNECNPYENTFKVYDKTILEALIDQRVTKGSSIEQLFNEEFLNSLPKIDPDYLDEYSLAILNQINNLLLSFNPNDFRAISIQIENKLLSLQNLEKEYLDLLVVYSTTLRHLSLIIQEFSASKSYASETWEECFEEKLRELQDCGNCYLEKIICVFQWPICLGTKALDCLIDQVV